MPAPPGWAGVSTLDPGAALAMLLSKMAQTQRDIARKVSDAEGKAEEAASAAKVHEMREQADATRTASYIQGGAGLIAAGVGMGGVGAETSSTSWIATTGKVMGAGKDGISHGAKVWTIPDEFRKEMGGAEIQKHEGVRAHHARARDKADESAKDAGALAEKAMQLYKEYLDAKNRCIEATILRM